MVLTQQMLIDACLRAIDAELFNDAIGQTLAESRRDNFLIICRRYMRRNGTAGEAIKILKNVARDNPHLNPEELVEEFAEACERAVALRPRWYSSRHFMRVIEIVGKVIDDIPERMHYVTGMSAWTEN